MPRRFLTVLGLLLSVALVGSLVFAAPGVTAQENQEDGPTAGDILDNPDDYFDQDVSIQDATVGEPVTSEAFTITANGDELLVVGNRDDIPDDISADQNVTVDGTVNEFAEDAPFVDDLGISPGQRAFSEFEGEPVIYAESVEVDEADEDGVPVDEQASLEEIFDNPELFMGEQVMVLAEVDEQISADAWVLSRDDLDDDLLVVLENAEAPRGVTEEAVVRVDGTVREFDPDDPFEYGGDAALFDPDNDDFNEFEDEPVLVADSFQLVAPALGEMVENIIDDPDAYLGDQVTVLGRVDEVGGDQAFAFDGPEGFLGLSEETLLVVAAEGVIPAGVADEAIVQVTGTVREYDPDDPFEFGGEDLGLNPEDEFFEDFEDDPIIVADSAQLLAQETGETIEEILDDSDAFLGDDVTVAGMVEEDLTAQAFALEGTEGFFGITEDNLLVIGAEDLLQEAGITEDVVVVVSGTIRQYDPDDPFEVGGDEIELDDPGLLSDWEDDEVLVAESATVIAAD